MIRRLIAVALLVVVVVFYTDGTAHAASAPSDVTVYVSDQFKAVAARTFTRIAADALAKGCPESEPICDRVAQTLADAFSAALSKDSVAVQAALGEFFAESSIAALLRAFGSVVPDGSKNDKTWTQGVRPLFACIVARMSGQLKLELCSLGKDDRRGWSTSLLNDLLTSEHFNPADRLALTRTSQALFDGTPMDPSDALRALAATASSKRVGRPDLRVFLLALSDWAKEGLRDGVFPATYRYLVHFDSAAAPETSADDLRKGDFNYAFLVAPKPLSDSWLSAARACGQDTKPIDDWIRTRAAYVARLRQKLIQGLSMSFEPLDALVGMRDCPASTGAPLNELRRQVRYFRSELAVEQVRAQYGTVILSIAALVDYVRSTDEAQLIRNLRGIFVVAAARLALASANQVVAAKPMVSTIEDVLRTCELQSMELALGIPVLRSVATPGQCRSIETGQLAAQPMAPSASMMNDAIRQQLTILRDRFRSALDDPTLAEVVSDARIESLEQAVALVESDDKRGAERILLRLGLDVLVAEVGDLTKGLGALDGACSKDAVSTSVFKGMDATCALQLLVEAAYQPIVDYYWNESSTKNDSAQLAGTVYKDLLATPYLDTTPIILNVGLGANYIRGASDYWGDSGYVAMTLVDKIGLAFYKYNGRNVRFETGPFVGGFLDALIRTLSSGNSEKYWLAGYAVGMTRMFGADLGLELHVGAAMPFSFDQGNRYGLAFGGAFVVPFNFLLDGGKSQ